MEIIRFDRFTVEETDAARMVAARNSLVAAVREALPGLVEARLARMDDGSWVDMWRWESRAHAQAAIQHAQSGALPQAPATFALVQNHTTVFAGIIAES